MNFRVIHRISFYLMLFFATLVLNVDSGDQNRLAFLYPVVVALAAGFAYFTVDRYPQLGLSQGVANSLALASVAPVMLEYFYDEGLLMLALGHWFCYLQIVMMFRPKTTRDEWSLFGAGVVQVVIGGVISQSDTVGFALGAWGLCALWVLTTFTLLREFDRGLPRPGTSVTPPADPAIPYPGLIDWNFVLASVRVAAVTLLLGGLIFLVMPRRGSPGGTVTGEPLGKHLTGFDDEVTLGQLGEILENDSVVMTIELLDERTRAKVAEAPEDRLWRGVGMALYERGRWRKMASHPVAFPLDPDYPSNIKLIRQQIKLEPTDNPVLFGLRPILWAESLNRRPAAPEFNQADGSLRRQDSRPISLEYVVVSTDTSDPAALQPREQFPLPRTHQNLLSISPELKERLRPIAQKQLEGIDLKDPKTIDRKAVSERLLRYLRDSGEFGYTLSMDVVDRDIDPVADFLINRKEGHCEYFASALALLLRSVDIPSRLINGFKGGDWNSLLGVLSVREKHAHTWVEVLLSDSTVESEPPHWMTLDPTPGAPRMASLAQVGGLSPGFRQFSDSIRYFWAFYVVGFNFERQQKYLYQPIRMLMQEARNGFQMMGVGLRAAFGWLFHFPDLSSFISIRGFIVTFVTLTLLVGLVRLGFFLVHRLRRFLPGSREHDASVAAGVLCYRRLVTLLEELGLERPPAETPREFARRAAGFLAGHGSGNESVADVPPLVVDAYYRIRFGQIDLNPDSSRHVETRLDALEARLRPGAA
jgi:transglutaminase-like putative cysteine protease